MLEITPLLIPSLLHEPVPNILILKSKLFFAITAVIKEEPISIAKESYSKTTPQISQKIVLHICFLNFLLNYSLALHLINY